jgi:hypothetical protein
MSEPGADRSIIQLGNRGLELRTFDELYRFSEFVVKAGFYPRGIDTKEKVFLCLQNGMELGLSPMVALQNSMVVNNRVSLFGDLVVGLVQSHPEFEDMDIEFEGAGEEFTCYVNLKRRNRTPSVGKFSIGQARKAGLLTDPNKKDTWGKYEEDMLFWRAFSRAKKLFADRLKGVVMPHEAEEQAAGEGFENARNVTPREPAKPEFDDKTAPADKTTGRAELRRAREQVEKQTAAAAAQQTSSHTVGGGGGPASTEKKSVGEPSESGPFDHTPNALETVLARLKKANISQLAFLKILAANKQIEPAAIERGLNSVPHQVLKNALDDWEEVMSQIAQTTPPR